MFTFQFDFFNKMAAREESPVPHGSAKNTPIKFKKKDRLLCFFLDKVVGKPIEMINCTKLPTKKIILRRYRSFDNSISKRILQEKYQRRLLTFGTKQLYHIREKTL